VASARTTARTMNPGRLKLSTFTLGALALAACRMDAGVEDLVANVPQVTQTLGRWVKSTDPRCGAAGSHATPTASAGNAPSPGHVVFRLPDGHVYRIEARAGAVPEDLTRELDRIGPGLDGFVNVSADGQWLLVQTTRFGCGQDMCTAVVDRAACSAQVMVSGIDAVHPEATSAIGARGEVVVFPGEGAGAAGGAEAHPVDLYAVTRTAEGWSAPKNLTALSPGLFNKQPAISPDGTRVLFDCGADPGAGLGTAVCEVGIDGKNLRVAIGAIADTGVKGANHHASYAPDGSIVFEGTWNGGAEQIWHVAKGKVPALVNVDVDPEDETRPRFSDDNSPCVLPDGRIASLWLGRKEEGKQKSSGHELKLMNADGTGSEMLLIGVDVVDIGIGCGQ
jgi:hypothetical protein